MLLLVIQPVGTRFIQFISPTPPQIRGTRPFVYREMILLEKTQNFLRRFPADSNFVNTFLTSPHAAE
jgi:hypothetical protein